MADDYTTADYTIPGTDRIDDGDEARERAARERYAERVRRMRHQEDSTVSDGASLMPGSTEYKAYVMDRHGLDDEQQEEVSSGKEDWTDGVERVDEATPDEDHVEMDEQTQEAREEDAEPLESDDRFVESELERQNVEHLARHGAAVAMAAALKARAAMTAGTSDDRIATDAIRDLEQNVDDGRSLDDMEKQFDDTVGKMDEAAEADEDQAQEEESYYMDEPDDAPDQEPEFGA